MLTFENIENRLRQIEDRFQELGYTNKRLVQSEIKKSWVIPAQSKTFYGLRTAICVDTKDPLSQGRVKFYSPALHDKDTPISALPFAKPVSSFGGFDDSGVTWVPPAGSTLVLFFENGDREAPYYIGTTWTRSRGPEPRNWNYPMQEFQKYHEGHRTGYLIGNNDGSQVLPPWNNDNYTIKDYDSIVDFENDPNAKKKITIPHIYGMKTPGKHRIMKDDGNYDCNFRFKRMEMVSGGGIGMLFKDDPLHPAGQWCHPSCGCDSSGSLQDCVDADGNPTEKVDCGNRSVNGEDMKCANPFFKRKEECRPYAGPGNPQNNRVTLPQSGLAAWSRSGNIMEFDDSVVEPSTIPDTEMANQPFDYGCKNIFQGKMYWKSAHGQSFEMSDHEEDPEIRSEKNRIKLESSTGIRVELNDHTLEGGIAGDKRGFTVESSSKHLFEMMDGGNEQEVEKRRGGNEPDSKAKSGYVRLKTGYGLQILMRDDSSQEDTQNQFIEIMCPQKDNEKRGPHILRMQEAAENEGLVFLRVGGVFVGTSVDDWIEEVGTEDTAPVIKLTTVKGSYIIDTDEFYYNHSDLAMIRAEKFIIIAAGEDCVGTDGSPQPCMYPIIVAKDPWVCPYTGQVHFTEKSMSDKVFASASKSGS